MAQQAKTLSDLIEALPWLDRFAESTQNVTNAVFGANSVTQKMKDWLNGTPIMHRLHPALVTVPIGAWTTGLVLDLLETRAEKPAEWSRSADAAIALGIVGAVPSVVTGLADWTDTYDHQRRVGIAHAMVNGVALTFYGASLVLRRADQRGYARLCSVMGFTVMTFGGMLGGELVYTLGVNVPHTTYPKPPNEFVDLLASADLKEGEPVVAEAGRVPVLLVRRGEEVFAVQNWCPHAGGPLSDGEFDGDEVQCPWHGAKFCLRDGRALQGPAATPLRTFEVKEEAGRIVARPTDSARSWPPAPAPA